MVTKGLNKITQNETQDPQLVDNFCKSWDCKEPLIGHKKSSHLTACFVGAKGGTRTLTPCGTNT